MSGALAATVAAASLLAHPVTFPPAGSAAFPTSPAEDLTEHLARNGAVSAEAHGDDLLELVRAAGLTGRGGGHFPAARKWDAVRAAGGGGIVVGNGAEGEPASAKDAALLQTRPHVVLDGLVAAAEVVGAWTGVLWLPQGADRTRAAVQAALRQRHAAGLREPHLRIELAPDRYLSGEATAVMRRLRGGPALPQLQLYPAAPWGEGNDPVLLHNVETLARTALLARGADPATTLSTLITLVAHDRRIVAEVHATTTIGEVVAASWPGRGPAEPHAVLLGGYGGQWLAWRDAAGLPLDPDALRHVGRSLGAGVVAPLPEGVCGLAEAAALTRYLATSSARQCGPCINGLALLAEAMTALASGTAGRAHRRRIDHVCGLVAGRGACKHPDGAVRMVASALDTFRDDVEEHQNRRRCLETGYRPVPAHYLPVPGAFR